MSDALLIADNLSAVKGERVLFEDISLRVSAGEFICLRGRNGAGKTTLLRQLAKLSAPQAGHIHFNAKAHWLGHKNGLKPHETPFSHLAHWAKVWGAPYGLPGALKTFGLEAISDIPAPLLSAGQRRRTALSRLSLQKRRVWLLDEPFSALDVEGAERLKEVMQTHLAHGGAIVTALHGQSPFPAAQDIEL